MASKALKTRPRVTALRAVRRRARPVGDPSWGGLPAPATECAAAEPAFGRGARAVEARAMSLTELTTLRLDALTAAIGFGAQRRAETRDLVAELFAGWGDELVGGTPLMPSDVSDDHTPVAFSVTLTGSTPEVLMLFESQGAGASLPARWQAALDVNRRIARRLGLSFERFEAIQDLFAPAAPGGRFAMWHALCLHAQRPPAVRVYLDARAQGRPRAAAVVREAVRRLGFGPAAETLATCARPTDALGVLSLDVGPARQGRVQVQRWHAGATRADVERELSVVREAPRGIAELFRVVGGGDGPFNRAPIATSLALVGGDERPATGAVYFPVKDICPSDRVAYERILRLLDGGDREHYARAMAAFAQRPLDEGAGMHTYACLRIQRGSARLSVGLAMEAYHVAPPSAGAARPPRGKLPEAASFRRAPSLEGGLLTDARSCAEASSDMGGLVSRIPGAVFRPRSRDDVIEMVRFCRDEGIALAARGQGTTLFGQSLSDGGVVIDMSGLSSVKAVRADRAVVDAGATWKDVLEATTAVGLAPPVLGAFQGSSVGGALSVGGIGAASYKRGAQVDHVLELEVVTGEGRLVVCSAAQHRELFEAVLAGLGQCALIVRATLRLGPAPTQVRRQILRFRERAAFVAALRELAIGRGPDGLAGDIGVASDGLRYELTALEHVHAAGRHGRPAGVAITAPGAEAAGAREESFLDSHLALDDQVARLAAAGRWDGRARPWLSLFVPARSIEALLDAVLSGLDARPDGDLGPPELGALGRIHLVPLLRRHLGRPLLRVPDEDLVFLFEMRTCAATEGISPPYRARLLDRNRRLYEVARSLGGTRYAPAAIPFSRADWIRHLGASYAALAQQKRAHDPDHLLGGAVGMF